MAADIHNLCCGHNVVVVAQRQRGAHKSDVDLYESRIIEPRYDTACQSVAVLVRVTKLKCEVDTGGGRCAHCGNADRDCTLVGSAIDPQSVACDEVTP